MADRALLRLGGAAAFVGGVLALVANGAHPRFSVADLQGDLAAIVGRVAGYELWDLAHFLAIVGLLLWLGTFAALSRSIEGDGVAWARLAWVTVVVGATVAVVALIVDGFVFGELARQVVAGESEAVAAALATAEIASAAFGAWQLILLGLAPVLYGMALTSGTGYPRYLGWLGFLIGGLGAVSGLLQLFSGFTTVGFLFLFTAASVLATIWVLIIGWHEWRKARSLQPAGP